MASLTLERTGDSNWYIKNTELNDTSERTAAWIKSLKCVTRSQISCISPDIKQELAYLGGILDENPHETDLVRLWFDKDLMTISRSGDLWTLTYKGETIDSPLDELPLAVRFLLNYTVKYNVVAQ